MKIKEGFMLRQLCDEYIVVAVGEGSEDFNRLITLNGVGAFIYDVLKEDKDFDGVVSAMLDKYDVDEATAARDAKIFIGNLRTAGLLDE